MLFKYLCLLMHRVNGVFDNSVTWAKNRYFWCDFRLAFIVDLWFSRYQKLSKLQYLEKADEWSVAAKIQPLYSAISHQRSVSLSLSDWFLSLCSFIADTDIYLVFVRVSLRIMQRYECCGVAFDHRQDFYIVVTCFVVYGLTSSSRRLGRQ